MVSKALITACDQSTNLLSFETLLPRAFTVLFILGKYGFIVIIHIFFEDRSWQIVQTHNRIVLLEVYSGFAMYALAFEPRHEKTFCIYENKDANQLHGNREADQHLCFRYLDSTIPLLPKSEISSLWPSSLAVQPDLSRTRSEIQKTGFLKMRLIMSQYIGLFLGLLWYRFYLNACTMADF